MAIVGEKFESRNPNDGDEIAIGKAEVSVSAPVAVSVVGIRNCALDGAEKSGVPQNVTRAVFGLVFHLFSAGHPSAGLLTFKTRRIASS